jgi:hypothetical protein
MKDAVKIDLRLKQRNILLLNPGIERRLVKEEKDVASLLDMEPMRSFPSWKPWRPQPVKGKALHSM